jgi:hypothetical protein
MNQKATPAKPTVAQLALLAASLPPLNDRPQPPDYLVSRAMAIWNAAHELLTKPQPPPVETPSILIPKAYPVTLDKFLGLVLPRLSGRRGDKYHIFRGYLRYCLCHPDYEEGPVHISRHDPFLFDGSNPEPFVENYPLTDPRTAHYSPEHPPDDNAVEKLFKFWRENPISNPRSFHYHASRFLNWFSDCYLKEHAAEVSAAHSAAAVKSHASLKLKKSKSHLDSSKQDG